MSECLENMKVFKGRNFAAVHAGVVVLFNDAACHEFDISDISGEFTAARQQDNYCNI